MDPSALRHCALFAGLSASEAVRAMEAVPHTVREYAPGETVFFLMDKADRLGILLSGRVQARKAFPNGSRVNVSVRREGDLIGAAAVFSAEGVYPCDLAALSPARILLLRREAALSLMQGDARILQNFLSALASAAGMLQERLELFSYRGIAQKAAFFLLTRARQTGRTRVRLPGSFSAWAQAMNVSRPSLHREVKKLCDQGILACDLPFIDLKDPAALEELLGK